MGWATTELGVHVPAGAEIFIVYRVPERAVELTLPPVQWTQEAFSPVDTAAGL